MVRSGSGCRRSTRSSRSSSTRCASLSSSRTSLSSNASRKSGHAHGRNAPTRAFGSKLTMQEMKAALVYFHDAAREVARRDDTTHLRHHLGLNENLGGKALHYAIAQALVAPAP